MAAKKGKRAAKAKSVKRLASKLKPPVKSKPKRKAKAGPRLDESQKAHLLKLLAAGEAESSINGFFVSVGWGSLSSSTISHYRKLWKREIETAKAARIDEALTTGLALRAERIALLKDHAEQLRVMRFFADKNGRLWNERAMRATLDDIARELGERRPLKDSGDGEIVKIYVGVDADKV